MRCTGSVYYSDPVPAPPSASPARWAARRSGTPSVRRSSAVHGRVPGFTDKLWRLAALQELAAALDGKPQPPYNPGVIPRIGPREVAPGIWAGNLDDVLADILDDMAALRADGRTLLIHCHGGASRTGLVLRAWLRRTQGLSADEATAFIAERWPHLGLWNASFTAALERVH
jgi:ADP-ribosyl-[dinitrogen reductase] hydrolase